MLLAAYLLTIFAFGLVSRRVERTILSAPVFVTAAGLALGLALGRREMDVEAADVLFIGELALATILFSSASRVRFRALIGDGWLAIRLLAIANPLMVVCGALLALLLLPGLSLIEACIVATLLTPNAGLATIESNEAVPPRIRQALGVESGLNDGVVVPLLMLLIALARPRLAGDFSWLSFFLQQLVVGAAAGAVIGGLGGLAIGHAQRARWMTAQFTQLALLALALLAWRVAEDVLGANGFIAAFTGGTMVSVGHRDAGEHLLDFTRSWGEFLDLGVLFLFGGLIASSLWAARPTTLLYALLSLTIVRMLPVAVALAQTGLHRVTVLFVGWLGPRGLSSIVLGLVFLSTEARLGSEQIILHAVGITVLISVFAHELSARPLSARYVRWLERLDRDAPEFREASNAPPTRARYSTTDEVNVTPPRSREPREEEREDAEHDLDDAATDQRPAALRDDERGRSPVKGRAITERG